MQAVHLRYLRQPHEKKEGDLESVPALMENVFLHLKFIKAKSDCKSLISAPKIEQNPMNEVRFACRLNKIQWAKAGLNKIQ